MSEFLIALIVGAVMMVVLPLTVYVAAKFGSYGWLMGKYQFRKDHPRKKGPNQHGNTTRA